MAVKQITTLFILRRSKGYTQVSLAAETNTTQSEISLAENGWGSLRREVLERIAEALNFEDAPERLLLPYDEYMAEKVGAA